MVLMLRYPCRHGLWSWKAGSMGAAERGAVEMKKNEFQGELEKQRRATGQNQSSHNFQMESVNKLYQDEKARPA